ncbi:MULTISPECIES: extracellular solute-binding protein [unclassified Sinorhizobium]|uniref:extracellular solute-binding protein n=1 Tax=unclassified Sinorhizobium TaxID=2613772 RepID=UPI0024C38D6D|nr:MULTISPECIES: extracellular solute-binding protein [unclassified Sinorhizobium]MDK1377450.1 extracellular solute-binding protein [Sinorhizobium sp. 6-70]MDK1477691.1 extracellular solute-binding protein [Sinorhizobium sp. 6-117]
MLDLSGIVKKRLATALLAIPLLLPLGTRAQDQQPTWHHGLSLVGELKYPPGFERFDYVNPDAPKGGDVRLSQTGTFDTFNPLLERGEAAVGLSLVFDTLLKPADDEISTAYGLLAEGVSFPDDISSATFRLRKEAKWSDGKPVTPEDVVFSFEKGKELNPLYQSYYKHVVAAEKTSENEVTFRFDEKNNRELPHILGQILIVPKHWWEAPGPDGKPRDINRTTLEPVIGSGPYRIASFSAGSTIRYERRDDYWGANLNVNVGQNNFGSVTYTFFGDSGVEFEAFRAGDIDFWRETQARRWATGYDFPAVKEGHVKREQVPFRATGVMQALVPNMRRKPFDDERVREALNYALDFEELNRTVFFDQYTRVNSYFFLTELASTGLPEGLELEILNEVKDKVPPEVFTTPYANPVGGTPQNGRDNLRKAIGLLKEAGFELKGNRMVNTATGRPFSFEILLSSPMLERVVLPYAQNLKRIGIEASVRTVDPSQYTNRERAFDYDMTWEVWGQTLSPGNEQEDFWGSKSASRQGSRNYAGISDPGVDALINRVIFAKDRETLVAATKALDRVLLAHHYVVPLYYPKAANIAYRDTVGRPAELPKYAIGFPDIWWWTAAAKQ